MCCSRLRPVHPTSFVLYFAHGVRFAVRRERERAKCANQIWQRYSHVKKCATQQQRRNKLSRMRWKIELRMGFAEFVGRRLLAGNDADDELCSKREETQRILMNAGSSVRGRHRRYDSSRATIERSSACPNMGRWHALNAINWNRSQRNILLIDFDVERRFCATVNCSSQRSGLRAHRMDENGHAVWFVPTLRRLNQAINEQYQSRRHFLGPPLTEGNLKYDDCGRKPIWMRFIVACMQPCTRTTDDDDDDNDSNRTKRICATERYCSGFCSKRQ